MQYILRISASFLPFFGFWFCRIFCLLLPYSCLISALFFDFGFLRHILLIPALFLAYSCLISGLFLGSLVFCSIFHLFLPYSWCCLIPGIFRYYSYFISSFFCFLQHILLIPALFLAYSCRIPAIFLDFGFLQHIVFIPSFLLPYSFLVLFLPYPGFVFVCLLSASICCLFLVFWRIFSRCLSMRNLFVAFWQQTANRKFIHFRRWSFF